VLAQDRGGDEGDVEAGAFGDLVPGQVLAPLGDDGGLGQLGAGGGAEF